MAATSKEIILKKIRQALATPIPIPFPQSEGNDSVFQPSVQDLEIEFAENFTKLLGIFAYCLDMEEVVAQLHVLAGKKQWTKIFCKEPALKNALEQHGFPTDWKGELEHCNASITTCESLVARTGSIVLSSAPARGRTSSVFAPAHICLAYTDQLVYDLKDGLLQLKERYPGNLPSLISFATGPSRTADIEKTLVVGIHGPKEVYLLLTERPPIPVA